jgi:hypothetical protein
LRFSKLKKLRFETQTFIWLAALAGERSGKILSVPNLQFLIATYLFFEGVISKFPGAAGRTLYLFWAYSEHLKGEDA